MSELSPCQSDPDRWDLSFGGYADWLSAIVTCQTQCPLRDACAASRAWVKPQGQILAGTAYGERGQELRLSGLKRRADRQLAAFAREVKGPMSAGWDAA